MATDLKTSKKYSEAEGSEKALEVRKEQLREIARKIKNRSFRIKAASKLRDIFQNKANKKQNKIDAWESEIAGFKNQSELIVKEAEEDITDIMEAIMLEEGIDMNSLPVVQTEAEVEEALIKHENVAHPNAAEVLRLIFTKRKQLLDPVSANFQRMCQVLGLPESGTKVKRHKRVSDHLEI